ncbi:calcium/sodium antiporter [Halorussus gelatinilyticus]|uniref:Calcium/sodium antiporter n=1 Tax=Halorussus gelatinilyticus TaxID=2937524 RepID=A0A8U0II25_9EURY|nr:calcium/sodium antiporter [Halorussus gelatinilyticus]UPW00468.1 calcium/sodium antiporter [Halorussus gelatinilyticus]
MIAAGVVLFTAPTAVVPVAVPSTVVQLGVLVGTVLGLWAGARLLVDSAVRLARRAGLSDLVVGLTVVAIGTSTPELVVSLDAALAGAGEITVANVVGSNIYNLAFILGVVSLVRMIPVERSLVHRDGLALVVTTLAGVAAMADLRVSRVEGLLFVGSLVGYTWYLIRSGSSPETDGGGGGGGEGRAAAESAPFDAERDSSSVRDVATLVVGLAVVLVSGHFMVEAATELALAAGISQWVVGGTIVAAGTSTPEFAVSLVAMRRGSVGVSVGNVVGSNVFNMVGVLGLAAVVRPLSVPAAALESVAWLTVLVVVMVAALWSGRKLSRAEGGLFALSEILRWILGLSGIVG